jgi:hypothetical protein
MITAPIPVSRFPTLRAALGLEGPRGMCFHRSVAMVLDWPAARLALGVVRAATEDEIAANPNVSRVPFIHAWVEAGGQVFPPTLIEQFGGVPPQGKLSYYRVNGIEAAKVRVMPRFEVLKLAKANGWIPHLRDHAPLETSFGAVLLDAAGIAWKENGIGGVIPA